jgi:probable phosphoglycerate mutase
MLMIARHGQTLMNVDQCVGGVIDSPLTAAGSADARLIGRRLAGLAATSAPLEARCSPMGRAIATCALICEAMPRVRISLDPRITAVDSGAFNGLPAERIAALRDVPLERILTSHDWFFEGPGGETFDTVWDRCSAALSDLPANVLLVTHGLPARFLRCIATGRARSDVFALKHPQTAVALLSGIVGTCEERMLDVAPDGIADAAW